MSVGYVLYSLHVCVWVRQVRQPKNIVYIVWWMVKFDIMNIRKVFSVEGFRYEISVYSVYEPLINFYIS